MMSGVDNLVSPTQKFFWTLIISTFDFLSDCYLIVPFMTQTADFPCKFTTSYITQVTPMEYDEFYEQLTLQEFRDFPGCFFEYACLNNVDCGGVAPVEDPRCTCNTQGLDDNDAMQDEIDVLWFFAIVYFIGLLVKELTKTTMIFLFFCKPSMQATKSLKYAVNTPMMLLLSWVPNLRKSGVKAHQAVLEKAEPAYNILIDVVLEDLPGLVIPLWYVHRGEPPLIAIISLICSLLSLAWSLYRVLMYIDWRTVCSTMYDAGFGERPSERGDDRKSKISMQKPILKSEL